MKNCPSSRPRTMSSPTLKAINCALAASRPSGRFDLFFFGKLNLIVIKAELQKGDDEYEQQMFEWIGSTMKIKITDNRILIGKFICTDKDANLILTQTEEYLTETRDETPRHVGMVMVPGEHIQFIKIKEQRPHHLTPLSNQLDSLLITGSSIKAADVAKLEDFYGDQTDLQFT